MKTNELNNGIKEVYTKPALEVEEMEVQWGFLACDCPDDEQSGGDTAPSTSEEENFDDC